jgi:hypothetical protein
MLKLANALLNWEPVKTNPGQLLVPSIKNRLFQMRFRIVFNTKYATQLDQISGFLFIGNRNKASYSITICTSLFRIFRKIQRNKRQFPR